jgi:hypothetical protein
MEGLLSRGLPCDLRAMSLLSEDESHATTDDLSLLDGGSDWYSRVLRMTLIRRGAAAHIDVHFEG